MGVAKQLGKWELQNMHNSLLTFLRICLDDTGRNALNDLLECERRLAKAEDE